MTAHRGAGRAACSGADEAHGRDRRNDAHGTRIAPLAWRAPIAAVGAFVVMYGVAAALYPGGTYAHPHHEGFSIVENYWCDLLGAGAYGRPNPGWIFALAGTVVLCAGLSVLWWYAPALFGDARRSARVVRVSGILSAAITPWIATRYHDEAIQLAGLCGAVGFVMTMIASRRRAGATTRTVAAITISLILADYLIWETGIAHPALALVQKLAFAALLVWIVLFSRRLRAEARGVTDRAPSCK